ncbi:MAG: adenosylcobinamide-phosphate synthase CbiB [Yoonia sp.]|jgi:adenosylcobinamide-phosphate synthase|tara:strand:- start:1401 stop:2294 length:894 start_codon:yes stop_codon:yes gene_type:complete
MIAMILDAIFGEPKALWDRAPHPAILMGRLIGAMDKRFNTGPARRIKGGAVMLALALGALALGGILHGLFGWVADIIICAILLAQKSLTQHVKAVGDALRLSIGDGRQSVAMIVGRDTGAMDQGAVARGAIESAAENLSDGIIAPAFWFAIGGLPGLLFYKITNTADSMIGYKTPRHLEFGWAAARLDDVVNWIPARITGLLIWALNPNTPLSTIQSEAALHRSPNAGWPEAAMAYNLNIALSGPRMYDGQLTDDPYVNPLGNHDLGPSHVDGAVRVLWQTWAAALCVALVIGFVRL